MPAESAPQAPRIVLFLCTGNYYRSRFAEYYFRHVAEECGLPWASDSRGLALDLYYNTGAMYSRTREECERLGIAVDEREPADLIAADLEAADLVVAVKEAEHRPLMHRRFPEWEDRVRYWTVHDLDAGTPEQAFPLLRELVDALIEELEE